MKKKIVICKLNRTLLKKEGTKEIYITANGLMSFFGYRDIEELPTSRKDPASKWPFFYKKNLYGSFGKPDMILQVTRENNEVRLTGFKDFFDKNEVNEVDKIILECIETRGEQRYLLDCLKCSDTRVLQSYDIKDSLENYSITKSEKGSVQFSKLIIPVEQYTNAYWLWDDAFDADRWNEMTDVPVDVIFMAKRRVVKKTIKIVKINVKIKKLLKARSDRQAEYQEKELYMIYEQSGEEWVVADFMGVRNLELTDEKGRIKISNRNAATFCLYEGGELE